MDKSDSAYKTIGEVAKILKLKSGDVYQVAEVVRNLALRDRDKGLSAGEKSLYNKAMNVLVSELSFALEVEDEEAEDKVQKALE